eukprot:ANDGO_02606.mRNA.1 hypothetical protein
MPSLEENTLLRNFEIACTYALELGVLLDPTNPRLSFADCQIICKKLKCRPLDISRLFRLVGRYPKSVKPLLSAMSDRYDVNRVTIKLIDFDFLFKDCESHDDDLVEPIVVQCLQAMLKTDPDVSWRQVVQIGQKTRLGLLTPMEAQFEQLAKEIEDRQVWTKGNIQLCFQFLCRVRLLIAEDMKKSPAAVTYGDVRKATSINVKFIRNHFELVDAAGKHIAKLCSRYPDVRINEIDWICTSLCDGQLAAANSDKIRKIVKCIASKTHNSKADAIAAGKELLKSLQSTGRPGSSASDASVPVLPSPTNFPPPLQSATAHTSSTPNAECDGSKGAPLSQKGEHSSRPFALIAPHLAFSMSLPSDNGEPLAKRPRTSTVDWSVFLKDENDLKWHDLGRILAVSGAAWALKSILDGYHSVNASDVP